MRGRALRAGLWLSAVLALLAGLPAWAQQVSELPSATTRCLVVEAGAPETPDYPFEAFKSSRRGGTTVRLEFSAPDKPPRVTVLERTEEVFAEAVRAHARYLRVPCLKPNEGPVFLERDYVFRPDDQQVLWFSARDSTAAEDSRLMKCRVHLKSQSIPEYPSWLRREGLQGRVIASIRFDAPDLPPTTAVYSRPAAQYLAEEIEQWAKGLRLPCHPGRPVQSVMVFHYILDDSGYGFKNVPFRNLLGSTAGIEQQRLDFDTTTMGCPFDVEFWYRRPHLPNRVGEIGERNAARRPLLEWMETIELKLSRVALDSVYGDNTRITIPCTRIDLKPKEKS